jgi:hypothetical protein
MGTRCKRGKLGASDCDCCRGEPVSTTMATVASIDLRCGIDGNATGKLRSSAGIVVLAWAPPTSP